MPGQTRGSLSLTLAVMAALAFVSTSGDAAPRKPPQGGSGGWEDHFTGSKLSKRWQVSSWWAPGYIPDNHEGFYEAENVSLQNGYLVLRLNQEIGPVDNNPAGVISHGAHVTTRQKYGYGTYEWRMRMSSTAATPTDPGTPVSGSVSAGFNYVNNSETEIDFEFGAHLLDDPRFPDTLYMVNWHNLDPSDGPWETEETYTAKSIPGLNNEFKTYKFVWEPGRITFYVDDVWQAEHTTTVPSAPAYFMINHWGTNNPLWGGTATIGVERYFYVDWVRFTPAP